MTATQDWKRRMAEAKADRPLGIGKQDIIRYVVNCAPELDSLLLATRWHNAWTLHTADPEITVLVEQAVVHFKTKTQATRNRLSRQKLKRVQ